MLADIRGRSRKTVLSLIAALALFALGVFLGRSLAIGESEAGSSPTARPPESILELRTERGAVVAATAFARLMVGPSEDEDSYKEEMAVLAAPSWRARADQLANNSIEFVRSRYGEGGTISFSPLKYRVASYSSSEAAIEVWGVVIASGPRVEGLEESWITGTVRIRWLDSEWKVIGQSSQGGPTPELLNAGGESLSHFRLEGFRDYQSAPRS